MTDMPVITRRDSGSMRTVQSKKYTSCLMYFSKKLSVTTAWPPPSGVVMPPTAAPQLTAMRMLEAALLL